jgi:hypothetical protein
MAAMSLRTENRTINPLNPSFVARLLRNQSDKVALTHINVNGTLFANYMQPDGVIDANADQVKMLQE